MKLEHLSASRIKTFEQCPQKYQAKYELKLPDVVHPLTTMGKAVHSAFEVWTRKLIKDGEYDPAFLDVILEQFQVDRDLHVLAKQLARNALDWGYFRKIALTVDSEIEFNELLPSGVKTNGFIDRLDIDGSEADVIDIKTQKSKFTDEELRTDWQGKMYNWAVRKLHPRVTGDVTISFWMLRHHVQRVTKTAADAACDEVLLTEKAEEIQSCSDPETRPSRLCPWCPKYGECAAARNPKVKKPWKK